MITSIDSEKTFDKNQTSLLIKTENKRQNRRKKPIESIILSGESRYLPCQGNKKPKMSSFIISI